MTKFRVTIVETIERIYHGIEIEANTFDHAERLATQLDTTTLEPYFEDVVEIHREVDLA